MKQRMLFILISALSLSLVAWGQTYSLEAKVGMKARSMEATAGTRLNGATIRLLQAPIDPLYSHTFGPVKAFLTGAKIGVDPDGSIWRTRLKHLVTYASAGTGAEIASLDPTTGEASSISIMFPSQGNMMPSPANWPQMCSGWTAEGINTNSEVRLLLYGATSTTPTHEINLGLWLPTVPGGNVIMAMVEHVDQSGKLLSAYSLGDPKLLTPTMAKQFSVDLETGEGFQTFFTVNNLGSSPAHLIYMAYGGQISLSDDQRRFAQAQTTIPANGGFFHQSVDEIFSSDPGYANFIANSDCSIDDDVTAPMGTLPQGVITIQSDQPISVAVVRRTSGVETPWFAFPSAAPPSPAPTPATLVVNGSVSNTLAIGESDVQTLAGFAPQTPLQLCSTHNGMSLGCFFLGRSDASGGMQVKGMFVSPRSLGSIREWVETTDGMVISNPADLMIEVETGLKQSVPARFKIR